MNSSIQKILFFIVLTLFLIASARGQQISLFNHYFYNPTVYNPAFTGNKESTNIMLVSRNQWSGFKNSPKLNLLSIDGAILDKKLGLGVSLFSDTKGINKTMGGTLMLSYKVSITNESHLRFGVSSSVLSRSIDFSEAIVENYSDPTFYTSKQNKMTIDGNAGLAYCWKKLELGIALNQFLKGKSTFANDNENDISYTSSFHYINSLKYTFTLNKKKQTLLAPQVLVRYVPNAPLQYELNTNFYFNKFWVGAAYKNDYAIAVNAGVSLFKKFDIGYSYDIITSEIGNYSDISHELMVNFKFGKRKEKKKVEEPEKEVKIEDPIENKDLKEEEPENDIRIITGSVYDFENPQLQTPKAGVYVVVGTFSYRELATKYALKIKSKGYSQASFIYSENEYYNYVYMYFESNKKDAINRIEEAKENASHEAWILILTD